MIGKTVGSYQITKRLGEGGMGAVYLAKHTLMGKEAAVKVLLPQYSAVQEVVERFFNEAKSASMIKHPGIVDVYDFGTQDDGVSFIVMELLEGEELSQLLQREPRLPSQRVALLGQQVARALEAAHALGIVHRDLKPDNIFLEPDSAARGGVRPKILDFGIAKLGADISDSSLKTRTGAVMGTPVFMSPEQCTGAGAVDHRSDIYSLGCILYLMVCGRPPFVKEGVGALIAAHITEAAPALSQFEANVDPDLESIIMSTLAKEPAQRPQSMDALANALSTISGHKPEKVASTRASTSDPSKDSTEEPGRFAKTKLASAQATTMSSASGPSSAMLSPEAEKTEKRPIYLVAATGAVVAVGALLFFVLGPGKSDSSPASEKPAVAATQPAESEPTPPAATPSEDAVEAVQTIAIELDSDPRGASVYNAVTGIKLGTTPFVDNRPPSRGELELRLKLDGFEDNVVTVPLDQDFADNLVLAAIAEPVTIGDKPLRRPTKRKRESKATRDAKAGDTKAGDTKAGEDKGKDTSKRAWGELAD